ncbi:MAG: LytTR family transcriptional regulator [Bacteroidales bacterium]|nr:LytTR family transcriptional regulator [Bacteroidales bacterium]
MIFSRGAQLLFLAVCPILFLVFVLVYEPLRLQECLLFLVPYLIVTIIYVLASFKARSGKEVVEEAPKAETISFLDIYQRPKLTVAPSDVLFIEARENYVDIHYLDDGKVNKYELRATMSSLGKIASDNGFIRCQRSFYINPEHVTLLRKESGGLVFAELDESGLPGIPVSRKYYEELSKSI